MNLISAWLKMPLGDAAIYALIGLVVVFAVLFVMIGILYIFKFVFSKLEGATTKKVSQNTVTSTESVSDDEQTVAAIMAAITLVMNESAETEPAPFTIKKIKRIK